MSDKFAMFANAAWDWSERNDIPTEFWRNEQGDWYVTLRLKDSRGWFSQSVAFFSPAKKNNSKAAETEQDYLKRVYASLSRAAQQARAQRIKTLNKIEKIPARSASNTRAVRESDHLTVLTAS